MRDEKGFDFKVLCVALGDAHQQHIERLEQVRPHRLVEIEHFFQTYKALEDKTVEMVGWREQRAGATRSCAPTARCGRPSATRPPRRPAARDAPVAAAATRTRGMPGRRLFVAVPAAGRCRRCGHRARRHASAPSRCPTGMRDVRWVRLDGLHLTLRFLGPTLDERIAPTADAVTPRRSRPGAHRRRPGRQRAPSRRTAGRARCGSACRAGVAELDGAGRAAPTTSWSRPAGRPTTRPFRAHLTLARSDGLVAGSLVAGRLAAALGDERIDADARSAGPVRERDRRRTGPLRAGGRGADSALTLIDRTRVPSRG